MIETALNVIREAQAAHKPKATVVLFSGGHDSTVLAHLVREVATHAAHINTGTGIPQTSEFVRGTCAEWGLPLIELVTPPEVYETYLFNPIALRTQPTRDEYGQGFPGPRQHQVIYYYLKQRRIDDLRRMFVTRRGERILLVTGIRTAESSRRMNAAMSVPVSRKGSLVWANPILDWTSKDMNVYRAGHPDCPRNEVADILHKSGECLCGAFASPAELEEIELWYPEVGQRLRGYERRLAELGVEHCTWGGSKGKTKVAAGPLCSSCVDEA